MPSQTVLTFADALIEHFKFRLLVTATVSNWFVSVAVIILAVFIWAWQAFETGAQLTVLGKLVPSVRSAQLGTLLVRGLVVFGVCLAQLLTLHLLIFLALHARQVS